MRAIAIVPVKRLERAKQRLASGIDSERRMEIVAAMLTDVLAAIQRARMIDRTIVVTGDQRAGAIAAEAGASVSEDPHDNGHSEAALIGIREAQAEGAATVVLLPGDCPLLKPRELDGLLTGMPEPYVGIVPDRHGSGTNALLLSPPDAIAPAFGEGSQQRHQDAARASGIPWGVEEVPSLALDLDNAADVVALTRELEGGRGEAANTARALGV